ncbi:MAG: hypothetical protein QM742_16815 [Aquabacterium sp.]
MTNLQPLYTPVGVQVGERIIAIAVGHSNGLIDATPFSPPTDERLRLGSYAFLRPSVQKDAQVIPFSFRPGHRFDSQHESDPSDESTANHPHCTGLPPSQVHPRHLEIWDSGGGLFMPTALGPTLIGVAADIRCKDQVPCPEFPSIEDHWTSVGAYRSDIDSAVQLLDQVLAMAPGTDPLRPRMAASAMRHNGLVQSTYDGLTAGTVHWLGLSTASMCSLAQHQHNGAQQRHTAASASVAMGIPLSQRSVELGVGQLAIRKAIETRIQALPDRPPAPCHPD